MLFRADLRQLERAPETFGSSLVVPELLLELADDRVVEMMRFDALAARDRRERVESGLRAVDVCHCDGAIEPDNRRGIASVQLIVMAQDAFPIGRSGIGREAVAGGDAGLEMIIAHVVAVRGRGKMHQTLVD